MIVLRNLFRSFVCATLSLLLFFHFYAYVWGPPQDSTGDISDIKYVIMQLTHGLTEVNRKHEHLQNEMERMSSVIPAAKAAAGRAREAVQPSRRNQRHALDIHDYDRQMADFALESAGGRVIDTGDTVEHLINISPVGWALRVLTALVCSECQGARIIINPGTLPGECWAFKGSRGEVTIRLLGTVQVTGVSVEHIPAHITPTRCVYVTVNNINTIPRSLIGQAVCVDTTDFAISALKNREISPAPRLFQVEGLELRGDPYPHDFGTFEYDKEGQSIQYFDVLQPSTKGYNLIRVKVLSNWGHPVYTCFYRFRVHGELEPGQAPRTPAMDEGDLLIENE